MRLSRWLVVSFSLLLAGLAGYALLQIGIPEAPAVDLAEKARIVGKRAVQESNDAAEVIDSASQEALRKVLKAADD